MQRRHVHRCITAHEAELWLEHFAESLRAEGVDEGLAGEVMAVIRGPARRVVNETDSFRMVRSAVALAYKGDLGSVRSLVSQCPELIGHRGPDGATLLWAAARRGRGQLVEWLLKEGAAIDVPGSDEHATSVLISARCAALASGYGDVAAMLEDAGARLDIYDAAYLGRVELVQAMLDRDPALLHLPSPADEFYPMTVVHYAVDGDSIETARLLVDLGAEVEPYSRRLLTTAVRHGFLSMVVLLLDAGAVASQAESLGPLATDPTIARLLVANGLDVNRPPRGRETFLTFACRGDKGKRLPVVAALLALGADPLQPDGFGRTPLDAARRSRWDDAVDLLQRPS
jgi:ankyrin repeat protein